MRKLSEAKIKNPLLLALGALLFALAAEVAYVKIADPHPAEYYPLTEIAAEDFESWEFREEGGGRYYALAYNSYFIYEDLGGIPAKTLSVRLEREAGDATECVLYYSAEADGVSGEFIAALAPESEGVYTAQIPCDKLYSLKIYPTETVRSTVYFGGVTVNENVSVQSFSAPRLLLWGFAALALYYLFIILRFILKKGETPPLWPCVYVIMQALLLLAVFQASRMFTSTRGLESPLLLAAFLLFTTLYACVWLAAVKLKGAPLKLAFCVFVLGLAMSFVNAPLQAPDEYWHYLRAYAISEGDLSFNAAHEFPDEVHFLIDRFPGVFYKEVHERGEATVPARFAEYFSE
ncbi:MAG: hypothetical protein Q4B42_07895, partial [Oscillospiraceae bacterium]|nr:hypothetical protein [Oscillospiraceae bacterium]